MLHNIVKKIPYGRQSIFKEDLDEVVKSLSNNLITTGPYVKKFENNFSKLLSSFPKIYHPLEITRAIETSISDLMKSYSVLKLLT